MNIQLVGPHQIDEVWSAVRDGIATAIRRGRASDISLSDVYVTCRSGRGFLFVADDLSASLVLTFETCDGVEAARIVAAFSKRKHDKAAAIEQIAEFARRNGATRLIFEGRFGWKRVFPKARPVRISYEMELNQ